jgi:hypothetical protein
MNRNELVDMRASICVRRYKCHLTRVSYIDTPEHKMGCPVSSVSLHHQPISIADTDKQTNTDPTRTHSDPEKLAKNGYLHRKDL